MKPRNMRNTRKFLYLPRAGFQGRVTVVLSTNTASISRTAAPPETTAAPTDLSRPVARPKTGALKLFRDVLDHGGPGYLQFAITNICNAKCDFCGFAVDRFDPKQRRSVTLQEARDVIDIALKNHIGYLLFVGRS